MATKYRAYAGGKEISDFYIGGKQTQQIWGGNVLLWEKDDAPDTNVRFAIRFILNRAIGQSGEIKGVNEIGYCLEPLYNYEIEKVAYYVYNLESPGGLYDQSYCVAAGLTKRDNYGWIMIRPYHALNGKLINIHYGGFSMDKDGYGIYSWGGKFEGVRTSPWFGKYVDKSNVKEIRTTDGARIFYDLNEMKEWLRA